MPALVAGGTVSNVHNGNVMPVAISKRENAARPVTRETRNRHISPRGVAGVPAHEPSAIRSVKHAASTTTSHAQRVVSWWYQIFHEGYSACSGLRGSDNGGPSEHMIRDCVVAIPGGESIPTHCGWPGEAQ
jgi:hypothetical protein